MSQPYGEQISTPHRSWVGGRMDAVNLGRKQYRFAFLEDAALHPGAEQPRGSRCAAPMTSPCRELQRMGTFGARDAGIGPQIGSFRASAVAEAGKHHHSHLQPQRGSPNPELSIWGNGQRFLSRSMEQTWTQQH